MKLATLTGSEKQIAWAEQIRSAYINWMDKAVEEIDEDIADENNVPEDIEELKERKASMIASFSTIVETKSSASWWINNRTTDPQVVAGGVYKPSYLAAIRKLIRTASRNY